MICSILIPSKWRFEQLKAAVQSFFDTADPKNFEVIIRLHDTDDESVPRIDELKSFGENVEVHIGRDKKPDELNNFLWNDIKKYAKGAWHQYWSDDMTIHGIGWDTQLMQLPLNGVIAHPEIHQLGPSIYPNDPGGPVPFIPADALPKYGYQRIPEPPDTSIDRILRVERKWKCHFLKGIRVWHQRKVDRTNPIP